MKKIGILFGQENTFPWAFIERINEKNIPNVVAEAVTIDKVMQGDPTEYAVIIDRISQDVPFYRAYLKNAAISGTAVINNPFWWSADEKFFNNALALKIGVPVPNTVILPSKLMPNDTNANSFRNLKYPLDWAGIFEYIGFPAYMKPFDGGGWKSVYKIHNMEDFFDKYAETEQIVMMLQSEVVFEEYFRCYCLGGKYVHIMPYEPRNPHHLRYAVETKSSPEMLALVEDYVLKLNHALGYDFNTVEFGVQNGIPYAIDFCNPAPDADISSVGKANFDWIVENAANFAIERALAHKDGQMNLTWGTFVKNAAQGLAANAGTSTNTTTVTTTKVQPKVTTVVTKAEPKVTTTITSVKSEPTKTVVAAKAESNVVTVITPKVETEVTTVMTKAAPKVETKIVTKAVPKAESKATVKVETKIATKAAPKAEPKAAVKVETKTATKAETKTVTKAAPKAEPKAAVKVETKTVTKVAPKAEPKATAKVETKAVTKAAPKAEPRAAVKVETKTVTKAAPKAEPKAVAKVEKVYAPKKAVSTKDDLKIVEGIGPKIEELLNAAGINTWTQLSKTKSDALKAILTGGGKRYAIHDPSTWADQAGLAAAGKMDELKTWQAALTGGKK
jgi:predicted flap endonuclease-1-like 5' DNA nuclease